MSTFPWSIRAQGHRRPVKHLIVAIRGVNRAERGEYSGRYGVVDRPEYWRGNRIGTRLYRELSDINNNVDMLVLTASLNQYGEPVISEVVNFITRIPEVMRFRGPFGEGFPPNWKFHPDCKIIIYGFSAGAYNALCICRSLDNYLYNYGTDEIEFNRQRILPTVERPRPMVDLLVTVDAVKNELSDVIAGQPTWSAELAHCVRWNLNYFLENEGAEGHGHRNTPLWDGQVYNVNLHTECSHSDANEHVRERVVMAVRKVICDNQCPW